VYDRDGVRVPSDNARELYVEIRAVTPGFFELMGTPRIGGRDFTPSDRRGTAPVVLVNASAARLLWPDATAIGHRLTVGTRLGLGGDRVGGEVVGVVGDVHDAGPGVAPRPTVYLPEAQCPMSDVTFVVTPRGEPTALMDTIRATVAATDPSVPIFGVRTMADLASRVVAPSRFYLQLVGLFAVVTIALAAVGIYGVMAQHVTARTREFGIRMALGAAPSTTVLLVLRRSVWLTCAGLVAGLGVALAARHAIVSLLFGVQPADGLTLAAVSGSTLVVTCLASWLPARRAARVDPIATLRAN
jgi:predicted lysophospholipase L1 biosynthesis ABC-type transport system permease subunit